MTQSLAPSKVTARDPKGLKFVSIVEAAYNKAGLSDEEAQHVNNAPGLSDLIKAFIRDNRALQDFKKEELSSNYGYLSGYERPRSLTEQANDLRKFFPGLGYTNLEYQKKVEDGVVILPQGAEGWFAIPNWMKNWNIFGNSYNEALQTVLDKIKETGNVKFHNYREGMLGPDRLRQSVRTKEFFRTLAEEQGNPDILIVPAQFGIYHHGRSVRRARVVFQTNEFGLGAFAIGCMLLTHENRLKNYDDLWINCAGDEYDDPDSLFRFDYAPYFQFYGDRVEFGALFAGFYHKGYGSASGFYVKL